MFASRDNNSRKREGIFLLLFVLCGLSSQLQAESEEVLGAAAITSEARDMAIPWIRASTDKQIAQINADAQLQMTQITSDNSKYLAASQERTSFLQSILAQQINQQNNEAQTQRLMMMLQERAADRQMQFEMQRAEKLEEHNLRMAELQVEKEASDEKYKLELMKLEAAKVQAGLSTGFTNVTSQLTSTPVNGGIAASTPNTTVASLSPASVTKSGAATAANSSTAMGVMSPSRKTMLASLGTKRSSSSQTVPTRFLAYDSLSQGSTRAVKQRGSSDLSQFQNSVASGRSVVSSDLQRHTSNVEEISPSTHASGLQRRVSLQ